MASIFRFICSILLLVLQVSAVAMPVVYGTDVGGEQYMCMYWQIAPYVEPKNMVSESIWDKRRAMCSNARCGFQKTCTLEDNVFTENTVLGKNYKFTFHIKVERRWPAKINNPGGFPDCYVCKQPRFAVASNHCPLKC